MEKKENTSVIVEIFQYGKKRKEELGEENVFDYSIGNPAVPAPQIVTNTMIELLSREDSVELHSYTPAAGDYEVRKVISERIKKTLCEFTHPSVIYMTCGASASNTISLHAVCGAGDEVIVLAPFFTEYAAYVEKTGAKLVVVPCKEPDFSIEFDLLEKSITEKTRAIIVNSPNNPSGRVYDRSDIEALSSMLKSKCAEFGSRIFIIADEPYRVLVYDDMEVPYIANFYDDTITCYSYSKALSLPGERIGYIHVSSKMPDSADIFDKVCGAARALGYTCAPTLMQKVAALCGDETADISVYKRNRDMLYDALTSFGYEAVHPDGAFYLFVKALEEDAVRFCLRARKYELLLVPSDSFGVKGYVRIAYCVSPEQIKKSIPAFKKLFDEYKRAKEK